MTVTDLAESMEADLPALADAVEMARHRGCRGVKLTEGRAILVASLGDLGAMTGSDLDRAAEIVQSQRSSVLRRSGLDRATQTIRMTSVDQAARMALLPPWSVYPLPPASCALLTCDLLVFETTVSVDVLADVARSVGIHLQHELQLSNDELDPAQPALVLHRGLRQVAVYPNSLSPLLLELVRPSSWLRGMSELLDCALPPALPWTRFADDDRYWLPAVD